MLMFAIRETIQDSLGFCPADLVLRGEAYLDDVVIYSSYWETHLRSLQEVFLRLSNASLTINLVKCELGKATVTYLGKQVGQGHVHPISAKVMEVMEFPVPTTR